MKSKYVKYGGLNSLLKKKLYYLISLSFFCIITHLKNTCFKPKKQQGVKYIVR